MGGEAAISVAVVDATQPVGSGVNGLGHWSIYETTIGNVPLISLVCEEIAAAGVTTARIVTHPSTRRGLGRMIGGGEAWGLDISYIDVPEGSGRRIVLEEITRALGDTPLILHPGDCLVRHALSAMAHRYADGGVDVVLPTALSSPAPELAPQRRLAGAPIVLGGKTRELVRELLSCADERADLSTALASSELRLARCEVAEAWRYSDTTEALLAGNRMVLDAMEDGDVSRHTGENQLHGRIRIAPSASVRNSVVFGPVSIGEHAVVEDSYVGPFTAIANDVVISGTEIDNAIVLAGAELRHPGTRIEASIIGVEASIVQSFGVPRGMHLRLGSGSRIGLS